MLTPRTPRLYKHKGKYSLVFYDPRSQKRKWIALGTASKTTADRRARPMILAYEQGQFNPWRDLWRDAVKIGDAVAKYEAAHAGILRPRSIDNTRNVVRLL